MSLARFLLSSVCVLGLVACDDAASNGNADTADTQVTDTSPADVAPDSNDTNVADTSPADVAPDSNDTNDTSGTEDTNVADTSPADVAPDSNDTSGTDTNVADTSPADVALDTNDTASAGACNNEGDLATLRTEETTLAGKIQTCVFQCLASGAACSSTCLQQSTDLSSGCADCFGGVIACTIANCAAQCFTPTSEACTTCRDQNCTPDFEACAGIQQP